ncbi:DUF6875 domain-containing protein [Streptomyces acidiscabies]|uniref:DUF6875 domain-containing protein n=1 Tax=Streptomyces acidiscabies TaxID=42234 RepID=A0AAP6BMA6_9ACTN|nr:hypothetical protein [Streptomyces acidiscabies]MBP5941985.1 hypothetical protein [Streptomyces sp. LBUM 1476]MBZ3913453.1 hypothetical protein [Streptomyces acidiscabies]MDX2967305.1 hypothetical protein [Streptomyces acidiscabies]MDX3026113.1 hypothetical protein [Streptomyces acidiscabies]MDX3797068.1 hypothetical protein [Streptomyces acidiscabies]
MTTGPRTGAPRTPVGALRLVEAQTTEPRTVDIAGYVDAVSAHCPYLAPSVRRGLTTWTVYEVACDDREFAEAGLFHAGVQAAEWVRPLASRPHGALVCENVVLLGDTGRLLDWPHWALKHLYGPVGLMIGKFHHGEERLDREDLPIPPPPYSFLPVRPAVRVRDPRFLADTPDLADALTVAVDDGRDVFAQAQLPHDWQAVKAWSRSLPVPQRPAPPRKPPAEAP